MKISDLNRLQVLCTRCGEQMRAMGEWPIQFPGNDEKKNFVQAARFYCTTCVLPSDVVKTGYPVGIHIIGEQG